MPVSQPQRLDGRAAALASFAVTLLAALIAGCGGGDAEQERTEPAPPSFVQAARSGSFIASGADAELVLRGVGGASAIGAQSGGRSAGAIATAKLLRATPELLGEEPWPATLAGAEVGPLSYSLLLDRPRYDAVLGAVRYRVEVEGGGPERPPASFGAVTLTLVSNLEGATLAGRVEAADGSGPLEGALVSAGGPGPGLVSTSSAADGRFAIGPMPAGAYEVEASAPGFERQSAELTIPGGGEASLALEPIAPGG